MNNYSEKLTDERFFWALAENSNSGGCNQMALYTYNGVVKYKDDI
jgi:hypothetical protein